MKRQGRIVVLLFLSASGLLVITGIIAYRMGLMTIEDNREMTARLFASNHLVNFLSALKDMETGQRGFLLTGEESYLEPYRQGLAQVQTEENELRQLAGRGTLPINDVNRLLALTQEKLAELAQTIQLRRQGSEAALPVVHTDRGKQIMDEIRTAIGQMQLEEKNRFAMVSRRADRATAIRTGTYIGMGLINFLLLSWTFRKLWHEMRRREGAFVEVQQQKELLHTTLASIGDAVIVTDAEGRVTFLNEEAGRLTGWKISETHGQFLPAVFKIINETTHQSVENPVEKVLRLGTVVGLANHTVLISKDGREIPIDDSAAPIHQPGGPLFGVVLVFRDCTDQRKIAEISARLAAIIEHSGDAIISKTLDGVVQTWNAGAERLLGYRPEEMIGKSIVTIIPPDRRSEEDEILGRIRNGKVMERFETIRQAKDGRHLHVSITVSPLKDSDGHIIGASKIMRDISDIVAAHEALAQEKELLHTTLASIGDAVIVTDTKGCVTFLNRKAEELTGWKEAEAHGQFLPDVFKIINETTREPVENPVEKVLRSGAVAGLANHTILISKDGREIPIDDSAAPIRQPGGPLFGVVLIFRDFTEHKQAEAALRESEERFKQLAENIPQLAWMANPDGGITWYNQRWYDYTGTNFEQMQGWGWEAVHHPEHLKRVKSCWQAALQKGESWEDTFPLRGKDGKYRWFLSRAFPIRDARGTITRWFGTNTDITELRDAEESLRQAQQVLTRSKEELETLVAERTAKLQEMVNELQHVSYSLAHDMRAPARAMNVFAEKLLEQESSVVSAKGLDYLKRIIAASVRFDKLIQDALNYTKAVQLEVSLESVDLSKLVRGLITTYPNFHPDKAGIHIDGELPVVIGNESLLTQCFSNLLGNAVKFVAPGVKPEVHITADAGDGAAKIWVKDNGVGIPQNAQRRLFKMFQKLDDQYEGTGIGLAIVRKVVERMRGKVGAESEPGHGSRFWVELRTAPPQVHDKN